jgi:hypothetical protein
MSSLVIGQLPGATALYLLGNLGRAQVTSSTPKWTTRTFSTLLLTFLFKNVHLLFFLFGSAGIAHFSQSPHLIYQWRLY